MNVVQVILPAYLLIYKKKGYISCVDWIFF